MEGAAILMRGRVFVDAMYEGSSRVQVMRAERRVEDVTWLGEFLLGLGLRLDEEDAEALVMIRVGPEEEIGTGELVTEWRARQLELWGGRGC